MTTTYPTRTRRFTAVLRTILYVLLFICTCASLYAPAMAQEFGRVQDQIASGTSYRIFARPGEATVQVVVVAPVGSGVYEVASDTDLGALVALTGGLEAESPRSRFTIRLLRTEAGTRRSVYEAPLEVLLLQPGKQPTLVEGDVLTIERVTKQSFNWRDMLSITTAVATLSWTIRSVLSGN